MTKREKQLIAKAMKLFHDDKYNEAMDILSNLIGLGKPFHKSTKNTKPMDVIELAELNQHGLFK